MLIRPPARRASSGRAAKRGDTHAEMAQLEQRRTTDLLRRLLAQQLVPPGKAARAFGIDGDTYPPHERLARRRRDTHMREEADEQHVVRPQFLQPGANARSGECAEDIFDELDLIAALSERPQARRELRAPRAGNEGWF